MTGRVLVAGLVAGLVMNLGEAALRAGVLGDATIAAYSALHRTIVPDPVNLTLLILITFVQGILMTWIYAMIRPSFRSRFMAAACVGLAGWILSSLYSAVYLHSGLSGIFPAGLVWIPVAWELVQYPLAMLAASAVYRE